MDKTVAVPSGLTDLTGQKFGSLVVLGFSHRAEKTRKPYWVCACECGNQKIISADNLRGGHGTHCGCIKRPSGTFIDLTGQRFGRFVIMERVPGYRNPNKSLATMWRCICDCGTEKNVRGQHLREGKILSCGCYLKDNTQRMFSKHGLHGTPEYLMWRSARERAKRYNQDCDISIEDIKIPEFCPLLGIPIFQNIGRRGSKANSPSLDRIDAGKGYTKDNIWVISHKANTIKSNATPEELRKIAKNLERKMNELNSSAGSYKSCA